MLGLASQVGLSPAQLRLCIVLPVMKLKYAQVNKCLGLKSKDARIVARELNVIQREMSVITPRVVVEAAADPYSPLHKYFEWNNGKAAQKYREWQARFLICSVYVVDSADEKAQPIRAFANCSPEEDDDTFIADRGYVAVTSLAGRQNYQSQVLEYAKNQLIGWRNKFGQYKEFFRVVREIDSIK